MKEVVLFALVGVMMVVVPMLIGKVYALTDARASCWGNNEPPFTNVVGILEKGKWKSHPKLSDNGCTIEWVTAGSGVFGGNEFGHVTADFGGAGKVTFTWFNPDGDERNGCAIKWTGKARAECLLPNSYYGPFAHVRFLISQDCENRFSKCTENGSVNQDSRSILDDTPIIIIGHDRDDFIIGGFGDDKLEGGGGRDILVGGGGKDWLLGGPGNDQLTGGPGPDTFVCGPGLDKITDYKPAEGDKKSSDCEQF